MDENDTSKKIWDLRVKRVSDEHARGPHDEEPVDDYDDRSFPPERSLRLDTEASAAPPAPRPLTARDIGKFSELLEKFGHHIGLPDLTIDEANSCTLTIGEEDSAVEVTVELRAEGEVMIFSSLEYHANGVSAELAARVELISTASEGDGYYLTTSAHNVFLCSQQLIDHVTSIQFADWVADFYKQTLAWRARYSRAVTGPVAIKQEGGGDDGQRRSHDPAVSASLRISPSTGLKV